MKNLPFIEEVAGPRVFEVAEHEGALFTPTAMTGHSKEGCGGRSKRGREK